jgi:hypothetical protein
MMKEAQSDDTNKLAPDVSAPDRVTLRSFFHGLAAVSANVIKATPEERKQLHEVADKCADEHGANTPASGKEGPACGA